MPDLLGPNPCNECPVDVPRSTCQPSCVRHQRWDARRELLEALKAGGVRADARELCRDSNYCRNTQCMNCPFNGTGSGHLIFIPEAQE